MKPHLYKALLFILRLFIYAKRAILWCVNSTFPLLDNIAGVYRNTVGFRLYKLIFSIKKQFQKWRIPFAGGVIEMLGRRGTLQVIFLAIGVLLLLPHSKLYTKTAGDINTIPGRDTVLFRFTGTEDYDTSGDEVYATTFFSNDTGAWRLGTVQSDVPGTGSVEIGYVNTDITGVTAGGTAITKPTIISGSTSTMPTIPTSNIQRRTAIVYYEVKPGDVIINIASQFGVSVDTILWANNLTARSYIRPGDKLAILPVDGVSHTVAKGDTVSKIARQYGVEQQAVLAFNDMDTDTALTVGKMLIIPNGKKIITTSRTVIRPPGSNTLRSVSAPPPSIAVPAGSLYIWPTNVHRITQYFGLKHTGVDIAGPIGSPLYAARAGRVIKSQCGWNGGYGCHVIIDHGGGVTTLYGHASTLYVSAGEEVEQGQTVALMGSTGRSTGSHIHFEVRVNGRRANPLLYVK